MVVSFNPEPAATVGYTVAAAYAFGLITRTPADRKVAEPGIDLADPEPQLAVSAAAS